MKKSWILLTVVAIVAVSCGNKAAKAEGEEKIAGPASSLVTEEGTLQAVTDKNAVEVTLEAGTLPADSAKGGTILLTKGEFLKSVWNYEKSPQEWVFLGDKPAIIDFYADWCGPCRMASPILEEVSHEFAGKITVYKIDTQKEQELAAVFGVQSIPAFLYIPRNGKPTMMAGIARSKEDTKKMFVDNINTILLNGK